MNVDGGGILQKETNWLAIRGAGGSHGSIFIGDDITPDSVLLRAGTADASAHVAVQKGGGSAIAVFRGDGNVGVGTTSPGNILTIVQGSATDPIADAWTTYSSRRWKTNIQTITGAVDKVERLRGVSFDWKADGKHDIGLIAEEAGEVIPEIVAYEENGKDAKSVDYARLVAVLIEAVKEQRRQMKTERDQLQAQIGELRAVVEDLRGKVRFAELPVSAR